MAYRDNVALRSRTEEIWLRVGNDDDAESET